MRSQYACLTAESAPRQQRTWLCWYKQFPQTLKLSLFSSSCPASGHIEANPSFFQFSMFNFFLKFVTPLLALVRSHKSSRAFPWLVSRPSYAGNVLSTASPKANHFFVSACTKGVRVQAMTYQRWGGFSRMAPSWPWLEQQMQVVATTLCWLLTRSMFTKLSFPAHFYDLCFMYFSCICLSS